MGNVGNPGTLIVNSNWILKQGTDIYILKNDLELSISRGRFRDAITIGPVNTFGAGDHSIPVEFEADLTKSVNWVNLNARGLDGALTNLPYTLEMLSKTFAGSGSSATITPTISNGKLTGATITNGGTGYTSVLITLSGGSPTTAGKMVGIISQGVLIKMIVISEGEGYSTAPSGTVTEVTSPLAFSFNAEVGDVSIKPSASEGRVKISATLFITDDAVLPIDA